MIYRIEDRRPIKSGSCIMGNGFLYHMVRNLTGTLLEVRHRESKDPEELRGCLEAKDP